MLLAGGVLVAGCVRNEAPSRPAEDAPAVVVQVPPSLPARAEEPSPPSQRAPSPPATSPGARAAVRAIQKQLVERGFAPGYPDGEWGERTSLAYSQFEATAGIDPDGEADVESLRALFAPEDEAVAEDEIQQVSGGEPPKVRGFTRTFALGAGCGFLLAAIAAAFAMLRQRKAAS